MTKKSQMYFENTDTRQLIWKELLQFAALRDLESKEDRKQILDYLKKQGLSTNQHENALVAAIGDKNIEVLRLLLILGLHAYLTTDDHKLLLLAHATATGDEEIVRALEETGLYDFNRIPRDNPHLAKKSYEELSLLTKVFSAQFHYSNADHLSPSQKEQLKISYDTQLERFGLTAYTSGDGFFVSPEPMNLYKACLSPLEYYCQTNLWDRGARALYQRMFDSTGTLDMDFLENKLAVILQLGRISDAALLAVIQCAINVAGAQKKTGESLEIHPANLAKIKPLIQELKNREASDYFKLKCAIGVGAALGASFIASTLCFCLLQNPFILIPLILSLIGAVVLRVVTLPKIEKQPPVTEQLKKLSFLNNRLSTTDPKLSEQESPSASAALPEATPH